MRLGGSSEVAQELGVSPSRVTALRMRPDFPDPVGEIALGPIWDLDVIRDWNSSGLRRATAGRPPGDEAVRTLGDRFLREAEPIGSGGFANVYRAVDKKTAATVAVKILQDVKMVDPDAIKRFRRELRIMEGLSHPNVVPVLGQGETSAGGIWYAMPLAQGSMSDYLAALKGHPPLIVDILRQIGAGLEYVHSEGIYHRDLKPANVLRLSSEDGTDSWAVSDFGLAVMVDRDTATLTMTNQGLGTHLYAAPEQWQNAVEANHLADIYGLGKILQEMATGRLPVGSEIPPGVFRPVIERAIAASPAARYQSVGDFTQALERTLGTQQGHQRWETREEQAERLRDRLLGKPSQDELIELLEWAQKLNEQDSDDMQALSRVLPWMSESSIAFLWSKDGPALARVVERFCTYVGSHSFSFEYCDTLANFMRRVAVTTGSTAILGKVVATLGRLGSHHNRWHVRDVLIKLLQDVKRQDEATEVVEALRSIPLSDLQWSISDFTVRSLPIGVRAGIGELLTETH